MTTGSITSLGIGSGLDLQNILDQLKEVDKSVINSELDFYFPNLKLAIEINGPLHYKPIYGKDKLIQIQNNNRDRDTEYTLLNIHTFFQFSMNQGKDM